MADNNSQTIIDEMLKLVVIDKMIRLAGLVASIDRAMIVIIKTLIEKR